MTIAQIRLGYLYLSGEGVPQDPESGLAWLQRAAEAGDPEAQTGLGMLYARGENVDQDLRSRWITDPLAKML